MLVYIYQASVYCEGCGEAHRKGEDTGDSNDYPQGPMPEGESDSPSHCYDCGEFLETDLTSDGMAYVRECVAEDMKHKRFESVACTVWAPYYMVNS